MKTLVSEKGSQEVTVERRDGCVVIRSHETKTHRNFSVTVFDELLAGLIAQLSAIAITRSPTLRAPDQTEQECPVCFGHGNWVANGITKNCKRCNGTGILNRSVGG